jgi:phosphoglycolate phosphatase
MTRAFDLIVFDWDGTLMDSAAHIIASVQAAAVELGWAPPTDAAVRDIIGLGLAESCAALFPEQPQAVHISLAKAYRRHFFSGPSQRSQLFAGVPKTIQSLKDLGYLVAVATGKSRAGLGLALRETGLQHYLDASRCADETLSKPHPRMLLEIMEELRVTRDRTLMVGDTEYDLAMARRVGVAAVGVTYGAHDRARLWAQKPLTCLGDVNELLDFLQRLGSSSPARENGYE